MPSFRVSDDIVTVSDFKSKAAQWLRRLSDGKRTLIITQKGRAAGVVLSPAAFDELTARARFVDAVEEGLTDVEAGRVHSHESVVAELFGRVDEHTDQ